MLMLAAPPASPPLSGTMCQSGKGIGSAGNEKTGVMERQKAGKRRGNAAWHVSMGARQRVGLRGACIIEAGQWEGRDGMFEGSVLATAE